MGFTKHHHAEAAHVMGSSTNVGFVVTLPVLDIAQSATITDGTV